MTPGRRLEGKVAIITGAGSGIGRASALLMAEQGARVVAFDIDADSCKQTRAAIEAAGGQAADVAGDVSTAADVERMVATAVERFGRLDVMFNNAGITGPAGWDSLDESGWDQVVGVNLKGVFLGCHYAVPAMRAGGGGSIINTSSVAGVRGSGRSVAYSASKGGVRMLTMSLAHQLGRERIRVNTLVPGSTLTGLTESGLGLPRDDPARSAELMAARVAGNMLGRWAEPIEIAYGALFLASDESSFVTGATLVMDGGLTAKF